MKQDPLVPIAVKLQNAWDRHQGYSGLHVDSVAFEYLHAAVSMLLTELNRTKRAENITSCLANGIQPD